VEAYVRQHFVAGVHQMGNFEVVTVNGKEKKQGGNVASYFCTPDGRVIHFVLGPASPKKLLAEASWAVNTYEQAQQTADGSPSKLAAAMQEAHRNPPRQSDKKAHQFLAQRGFPLINQIQVTVFEDLLNQDVSQAGPYVAVAARKFQQARERGQPVVLFLYQNEKKTAQKRYGEFLSQPQVYAPLMRCAVIGMPLDELPALSSALDIPVYQVPAKADPVIVIAHASGEQIGAVSGMKRPEDLSMQLWSAIRDVKARSDAEKKVASAQK
jgi:hypothetical protein